MTQPVSLHEMLRTAATQIKSPSHTFLLQKKNGPYEPITFGEIIDKVNAVSAFLISKGYQKGDRVAMLLDNCPDYLIVDQALMQIGCVNVSIYPTLPEDDIAYIINDSGAKCIMVGNPFLLKKVMKKLDETTQLKSILLNFEKSKAKPEHEMQVAIEDIFAEGKTLYEANHAEIENQFKQVGHDDLASLIYTSGTTGVPKGVMLTHGNFISNVIMAKNIIKILTPNERYLSFLPLCHVYERTATYYLGTHIGAEIAFAQSIESVASNIQEAQPTLMTAVPRLLERMRDRVIKNAEKSGGIKTKIFYWALEVGRKSRERKAEGKGLGPILSLQHAIAEKLVFSKVKEKLGGKMRLLVSGGAALPQYVGEFFGNLGIVAVEGYGLTETAPLISVNEYDRQVYGTVGRVVEKLEVGILSEEGEIIAVQTNESFDPKFESGEGEIIVRGPSIMKGYWNKPEETSAVIDKDGWFHTGDVGKFHLGNLKITDRIKNMLVNALGKNIYPTPVENVYLSSMKIDQIFLIGDKREFVSAIIVPNKEELQENFKFNESFFEEADPFIREAEVHAWIASDVKSLSGKLAKFERIKNFVVKRTQFTVESGEITPTLKTKRKVIETRYAYDIERMYQEGETEN
ncbi:MAG: long-chain fatty acid--CoA ligase [Bacteroidetes bacterium]|nr:MAG: long-chain fatty acid--CoA ligase [Bacteroidota bacterium]